MTCQHDPSANGRVSSDHIPQPAQLISLLLKLELWNLFLWVSHVTFSVLVQIVLKDCPKMLHMGLLLETVHWKEGKLQAWAEA